jgi:hypothetical protein
MAEIETPVGLAEIPTTSEEISEMVRKMKEEYVAESLKKFAQDKRDRRKARNLKLKANGGLREFKPNGRV